jgi:hypothetical protein
MADRFDPRLSVRGSGARKLADHAETGTSDPLAELARIVSGRGNNGSSGNPRTRVAAVAAAAKPEPNVMGDLEAELLNDLQASFVPAKNPVPAKPTPPAAPMPAVTAPPPRHAGDGIVRDRLTDALAALAPVLKLDRPLVDEEDEAAPTPTSFPEVNARPPQNANAGGGSGAASPPIIAPATSNRLREALNALPKAGPLPPADNAAFRVVPSAAPPETAVQVAAPSERPRGDRIELPNLHLRSTQTIAEARPRGAHSRWEKPAEPPKSSRFAPPTVTGVAPPPVSDEDDDMFAEGQPFADDQSEELAAIETEGLELPNDFADEEVQGDPDFGGYMRARSRRRMVGALSVLALIAAGGIAFGMLRAPSSGALPPLITADSGPSKVAAPVASGEADQSKLIYDRVGAANSPPAPSTLVKPPTATPVAPPSDANASNPISQLIGASGGSTPAGTQQLAPAQPVDDASQTNEPRKVRTVVVKPDGTILRSEPTDSVPAAPAPAPPIRQVGSPTVAAVPPRAPAGPAPRQSSNETLNVAGAGAGSSPNGDLAITTTPSSSPTPGVAATPATGTPVATAAPVKAPSAPVTQPATNPTATPAAPPPAKTAQAAQPTFTGSTGTTTPAAGTQTTVALAAGGVWVQVSSQKDEDGARATFKDLQAHYLKILGGYDVNIQRADLGTRGVFFRARVGPFSQADAKRVCDDLKSAGGDCIIATS